MTMLNSALNPIAARYHSQKRWFQTAIIFRVFPYCAVTTPYARSPGPSCHKLESALRLSMIFRGNDMSPWVETIAVGLLAGLGVLLGIGFSRLPKPYWTIGYFIPLALALWIVVVGKKPELLFVAPASWLMRGRMPFAVIGFIATLILTTPLRQLPNLRSRLLVNVLMTWIVVQIALWPFLAPAFNQAYLASLTTNMDSDGICRQSNEYNCGPAAAVTALRKLGFPAEEGQLAILARTSSAVGTPPDMLAKALQDQYGSQGLVCEYRLFKGISELRIAGLTLAVIELGFLVDHYVVVLEVTDQAVIVADPLSGIKILSHREFTKSWRSLGIVLKRRPSTSASGGAIAFGRRPLVELEK